MSGYDLVQAYAAGRFYKEKIKKMEADRAKSQGTSSLAEACAMKKMNRKKMTKEIKGGSAPAEEGLESKSENSGGCFSWVSKRSHIHKVDPL